MIQKIRNKMDKKNREDGFTLIELLVVILIIGILAAIAIPVFMNQQQSAIKASVKSDVRSSVDEAASYLTSNPNAESFANARVVASRENVIAISGGWDNYVIKGTSPEVEDFSYCYDSLTGKSGEGECGSFNGGVIVGDGGSDNGGTDNPSNPGTGGGGTVVNPGNGGGVGSTVGCGGITAYPDSSITPYACELVESEAQFRAAQFKDFYNNGGTWDSNNEAFVEGNGNFWNLYSNQDSNGSNTEMVFSEKWTDGYGSKIGYVYASSSPQDSFGAGYLLNINTGVGHWVDSTQSGEFNCETNTCKW